MMDKKTKQDFVKKWRKYFKKAELPFIFFYSNDEKYSDILIQPRPETQRLCMISQLNSVRRGKSLAFSKDTVICQGGLRYSGFTSGFRPNFKYFLSCGIPGKMEGERYKKTPEIVEQIVKELPQLPAEGKYLVFRPWESIEEGEEPQVVIFYEPPDVVSALLGLSNFRSVDPNSVVAPFSSGCGSIIAHPLAESKKENPKAVLGMFDITARPVVEENILSFSVPLKKFLEMDEDMDESFLITRSWEKVRRRLK
jgi:uncharacterized protein (DUF169 family)